MNMKTIFKRHPLLCALFALALWADANAQAVEPRPFTQPGAAATVPLHGLDCMIQPSLTVQVGSPSAGIIDSVGVDRGDVVRRGQVLAQLNAQVEQASLAVARERARQVGEVEAAASLKSLANSDLKRAEDLLDERFVSEAFVERATADAKVARGKTTQAEERRKLAARELQMAAAQLSQRIVRAPIDGIVVDRYLGPGEYIEQKPLLRLAAIDPLRVDVLVPAAAFGRVQVGDSGSVVPELLDRRELSAVVKTVDRVIDAASNTFRVRLELPNPDHRLPAGLRCIVSFDEGRVGPADSLSGTADAVAPPGKVATATR